MTDRGKLVLTLLIAAISLLAIGAFISLMVEHRKQVKACESGPQDSYGISVHDAYCASRQ